MDNRICFKHNKILDFGDFQCHIDHVIGKGSNAIVYKGWYADTLNPDQKHSILIKELYPDDSKNGITRLENDELKVNEDSMDFFDMHKKSFEIGNDIHLNLLNKYPSALGANLNSYKKNNTLYSILGYSGGKSLNEALCDCNLDLRQIVQIMLNLLDALDVFHKSGYLHLDISPDNIMLVDSDTQKRVFLIDYNSVRSLNGENSDYLSCKAGYSAPEVEIKFVNWFDFSSDLYSVAAVFFYCIMGRRLTLFNRLNVTLLDCSTSIFLEHAPQTVTSFIKDLLQKGLNTDRHRRYRKIEDMRIAFQELLDRIDCVGITHWSLWESGKKEVDKMIKENSSLHYIKDELELYPIRVKYRDQTMDINEYANWLISKEGTTGLLLGKGGMGKTTLLMHVALQKGKKYSPGLPAIIYLSLSGWKYGQTDYIRHQILINLRCKPGINTYESALHTLNQLLKTPISIKNEKRPVLLLLLDGLNEIQGDLTALLDEIRELNNFAGVRILCTSRSEMEELNLETFSLSKLSPEDVEYELGRQNLWIPENSEMLELLRTPIILSMYCKISEDSGQMELENESDLIQAYLQKLYEKETRKIPESSPQLWQIQVAIEYVLPSIAIKKENLTEIELLKIITECWNIIHSKIMTRVFPKWIGHSRDIFGDTETPEQWMGIIVYSILWYRLGLLVKFSDDRYQVFHQIIRDYLKNEGIAIQKKIHKYRWMQGSITNIISFAVLKLKLLVARPTPYDSYLTDRVFDSLVCSYGAFGSRLQSTKKCLEILKYGNLNDFIQNAYRNLDPTHSYDNYYLNEQSTTRYLQNVERLCQSGDQVLWSKLPLNQNAAKQLITEASEQVKGYRYYMKQLIFWCQNERAQKAVHNFPIEFDELLETDAQLLSKLYYISCYIHLKDADPFTIEKYEKAIPSFVSSGREPNESVKSLEDFRNEKKDKIEQSSIILKQMM